ncbi:Mpv17/PMP22 family protein [Candidatus Woesearchaeota archaeon]|nr:Mpv17/PMP22 family protein [Candidatus Woesearchaeota archaeon]
MAEASPLEQAAKTAPHEEKKEEKKPVGALESVVNETIHAAGNLIKLGLAVGIPTAQALTAQSFGNPILARDTAIMAGAQVAADATINLKKSKKYMAGNVLESAIMGTALAAPLHYMFKLAHKVPLDSALGYLGKAAVWGGFAYPAYVGFYQAADYLIKNRTFKGLGKYIKENYWPTLKKAWTYLLPISLLNVFFAPTILNVPIAAGLTYLFDLFGAPKKGELQEDEKRDKTPYYVAAPRVAGRLAYEAVNKLVYNPLKALYEIGSGFYKSAPTKTETPTNAQAAAQGAR